MRKIIRKYAGLVALILIAFVVVYFIHKREINKLEERSQLQAVQLAQLQDSILTYETKNGLLISKFEAVEVERRNLKEALELIGIEKKDLRDQNIKLRNLVSVLQMEIKTFGEGQTNVVDTFYVTDTDTIYYQKVEDWTDSYLSLFNAKVENKKFNFEYNYLLDMDLLVDKSRNKVIVTANLNNPNIESIKATSITVPTKPRFYERPLIVGTVSFLAGFFIAK